MQIILLLITALMFIPLGLAYDSMGVAEMPPPGKIPFFGAGTMICFFMIKIAFFFPTQKADETDCERIDREIAEEDAATLSGKK